jgi:hypothetical protein
MGRPITHNYMSRKCCQGNCPNACFRKKYIPQQEEIRLQNAEISVVPKDVGEEITATVMKVIKTKPVQLEMQVFQGLSKKLVFLIGL